MTSRAEARIKPLPLSETAAESVVFSQLTALLDPVRARLLLLLERQELTVRELQQIMQLPQSTVSRHLRLLSEEGWVTSRSSGASNWYRMASRDLSEAASRTWQVVRSDVAALPAARRDAERTRAVLAEREQRSREFFATSAGQWNRLRVELFGRALRIAPLVALAEPGWVVADLGCGTGELAADLAGHVARVIAIDDSPSMLDAARARLDGHANVELRQSSLERLPIGDATVDVAFLVLVLHHLSDPGAVIAEAARVLAPGGRLVIVDMAPHEHAEYRELMGHQWLGFDAATLERWCAAAGLVDATCRAIAPDPEARGPSLLACTARRPAGGAVSPGERHR